MAGTQDAYGKWGGEERDLNSRISLGDTDRTLQTWYSTSVTLTGRHCSESFQDLNTLLFQARSIYLGQWGCLESGSRLHSPAEAGAGLAWVVQEERLSQGPVDSLLDKETEANIQLHGWDQHKGRWRH